MENHLPQRGADFESLLRVSCALRAARDAQSRKIPLDGRRGVARGTHPAIDVPSVAAVTADLPHAPRRDLPIRIRALERAPGARLVNRSFSGGLSKRLRNGL